MTEQERLQEEFERQRIEENRFGFYREKTDVELEKILEDLTNEYSTDEKIFNNSDSDRKTEAHRDMIYDKERIDFVKKVLEERKRENPIYYQLKGLSDDILEERLLKAEELHEENKNILEAGVQDPETRREIHGEYISAGMEASAIERILKEREGSKKR